MNKEKIDWCACNTDFVYRYNPNLLFRIKRFFFGGQSDYAYHLGCGKPIKPEQDKVQKKILIYRREKEIQ